MYGARRRFVAFRHAQAAAPQRPTPGRRRAARRAGRRARRQAGRARRTTSRCGPDQRLPRPCRGRSSTCCNRIREKRRRKRSAVAAIFRSGVNELAVGSRDRAGAGRVLKSRGTAESAIPLPRVGPSREWLKVALVECAMCHQVVERTSPIQRNCTDCRRAIRGARSREAVRRSRARKQRLVPIVARPPSS
jgi:hypothetical protein